MNKLTATILMCLFVSACADTNNAKLIHWNDGKSAYQYTSYSHNVWVKAGEVCPSGYDELRSVCDEHIVCTVVFRCKGVN